MTGLYIEANTKSRYVGEGTNDDVKRQHAASGIT